MIEENIKLKGDVERIIEYSDGRKDIVYFNNNVLDSGREALASALAGAFDGTFNFFVSRMVFGDGGTSGDKPRFVNANRTGLFGTTRASKSIIANIDPNFPSQVVFTSIITFDEANGFPLNEMALVLNTGEFYSMATFADLNKTSSMQITWNWRLTFV